MTTLLEIINTTTAQRIDVEKTGLIDWLIRISELSERARLVLNGP